MRQFQLQMVVLVIYTMLTVLMTWPAVLHVSSHVIGQGGDPWQTMWRFENQELGIGNWEFWTDFFGGGQARLVNYATLPWMWLQMLFGQPVAYNIVWLLSYVLSGYFMFLFVRWLLECELRIGNREFRSGLPHFAEASLLRTRLRKGSARGEQITDYGLRIAPFLAGLYYMFLPYHVAHSYGHFGAMQLQWLPLALLLLFLFVRRPTIWNMVGLGFVLTLQAWTEHHYALWLALLAILLAVWRWRDVRSLIEGRQRPYVVVLISWLFFFVLLPYWPTVRLAMSETNILDLGQEQTIRFSADLFSYIVPAPFHSIWGGLSESLFTQHFTGNVSEATQYLGILPLLLVIFFRGRIPRAAFGWWVAVATVFLVISLGPRLHILGTVLPIPLPYALIDSWPPFSSVRAVARAGVMVALAVAVLLGWVIATHLRRRRMAVVVGALIMLDFLFMPMASQSTELSPVYQQVAALPGRALIEIPAATNYTAASRALYASHRHGKEVIGNIALERAQDAAVLQEVRSLPALRQLLYLRTSHLRQDRPDFFAQDLPETLRETFAWLDVGGVVIHRDSLSALQIAALDQFLTKDVGLVAEHYNDVVLYPVPRADAVGDGVFLARDSRWEHVGFDEERNSTFAEVPGEAAVTLTNIRAHVVVAELRFAVAPESPEPLTVVVEGRVIAEIVPGTGAVVVPVTAAPGQQTVVFKSQRGGRAIIQNPELAVESE